MSAFGYKQTWEGDVAMSVVTPTPGIGVVRVIASLPMLLKPVAGEVPGFRYVGVGHLPGRYGAVLARFDIAQRHQSR